jgi:nucleoside-diphosphate-sugar epimerase
MARILITGAGGLVGRQLAARLASGGAHTVTGLVRQVPPGAEPTVHWQPTDLCDPAWTHRLPAGVDTVFHLAQSRHFRAFPDRAMDVFEVNVGCAARLLDWAWQTGVRRVVLASTGGLYGSSERAFTEDDAVRPGAGLGYYLTSKWCAELLAQPYADRLAVVTLRVFFVYGPGQGSGMLIPRLVRSVQDGTPITLQGASGIRLNPIHVQDAARAMAACLTLDASETINIAGSAVLTLEQIAETIGQAVGRAPVFTRQPEAAPSHLVGDITRMRERLTAPEVDFEAGIRALVRAGG